MACFALNWRRFWAGTMAIQVSADNLFVTSGASQALDLICTLFTRPGDTIFVEEPSYFLALRIFADHHLNVVSIPIDEHGMKVDALAEALTSERPRFVYTIPTFQNPTGVTLTQTRRDQLVALSREYDFLIVADEVYHLLDYAGLNDGSDVAGAALPTPFAAYVTGEDPAKTQLATTFSQSVRFRRSSPRVCGWAGSRRSTNWCAASSPAAWSTAAAGSIR